MQTYYNYSLSFFGHARNLQLAPKMMQCFNNDGGDYEEEDDEDTSRSLRVVEQARVESHVSRNPGSEVAFPSNIINLSNNSLILPLLSLPLLLPNEPERNLHAFVATIML